MTDIAALVAENLDIWTGATQRKSGAGRGGGKRISLYGIERLRALILDLAVRGKLVPQDAADEPASELLKRIDKIRTATFAKSKSAPHRITPQMRLATPLGWDVVRLDRVANSQAGFAFKSKGFNQAGTGLPLIRIRDVGQPFTGTFYSDEYRDEFVVIEGDYLISMDGEFRVATWPGPDALLNQRVSRLQFYGEETSKAFVAMALQIELAKLQGVKAYTTVDHLSGKQISDASIPLPPLAEQRRIVAKVDELMALCDALEREAAGAMTAHQALVEVLLATLVNSADATDLARQWARLESHFETLFTTGASIDTLKQTILDLAVRGKLVEQDAGDEAADKMLVAAKRTFITGASKAKLHPPIKPADEPFRLPPSWRWERFDNLIQPDTPIAYGVLVPGDDQADGIPFVRIADLSIMDPPVLPEKAISPEVDAQYERTRIKGGEILMGVVGSIGKLGVAPPSWAGANIARAICRIVPASFIDRAYVLWLLQSKFMQDSFKGDTRTLAQPTLNLTLIRLAATPIPPLAEQHRIVAKVDALMALCDALKARLADAAQTQCHLADVITERAAA